MYDFTTHQHNFAIWASACAVHSARVKINTIALKTAIEASSVVSFLKTDESYEVTEDEFDCSHRIWCAQMKASLLGQGLPVVDISHGLLSKAIAIYLKSIVVLGPRCESRLAFVAHPPIDSKLLSSLWKSSKKDFKDINLSKIAWSNMREDEYYALIKKLRGWLDHSKPFWALEEHWPVV